MVMQFPIGRAAGSTRAEISTALASPGPSRVAARRLLPFVVAAPLGIGWLCLQGHLRGGYGAPVAVALFAGANALILSAVVWSTAFKLHGMERQRREIEESLGASEERFRSVAEALPELIAGLSLEGTSEYCSPYDAECRVSKWVATATDIDERKRAAAELLDYTERLQASNRELTSFAYVASHDLQEPLRTLSGFSEILAERYRGQLDAEADALLGFIQDGSAHMQALIQGLLAYSRVETQGQGFSDVDSDRLLDGVLRDLGPALRESGAVVSRGALPVVRADATQLAQVFRHLLANALQHRRADAAPRIHVEAGTKGKWSCFTVSDNGLGIDPQHFERIFVLFQRLPGGGENGGTGIGLAICKRVVERHGGRIWVEPCPGGGSTFCFTLANPEERAA